MFLVNLACKEANSKYSEIPYPTYGVRYPLFLNLIYFTPIPRVKRKHKRRRLLKQEWEREEMKTRKDKLLNMTVQDVLWKKLWRKMETNLDEQTPLSSYLDMKSNLVSTPYSTQQQHLNDWNNGELKISATENMYLYALLEREGNLWTHICWRTRSSIIRRATTVSLMAALIRADVSTHGSWWWVLFSAQPLLVICTMLGMVFLRQGAAFG